MCAAMLDDEDITDEPTRRVNEALRADEPIDPADWQACRNASLMLEVASRRAPRLDYVYALTEIVRAALPVHSSPRVFDDCLRVLDAADVSKAREAANWAWCMVSRRVAGVDDDVGLAVCEACELLGGAAFEINGPDPAYRAAWAWACKIVDPRTPGGVTELVFDAQQASLADRVREAIPDPPEIVIPRPS